VEYSCTHRVGFLKAAVLEEQLVLKVLREQLVLEQLEVQAQQVALAQQVVLALQVLQVRLGQLARTVQMQQQ
jgi:hypothetical protein